MKKLGVLFAFVLVLLACANASAKVVRVKAPVVKVVKSEYQPEVTAIAQGSVFAQFTGFDLNIVGGKGDLFLNNVRVEIYSDGKFGIENTPTIGQFFKKICLIANTSWGNSPAVERTIIASLDISGSDGLVVDLGTAHWFGNNAKFTVVGIPRDEALHSYSGRTIGLAVIVVDASDKRAKKARVSGKFPIMGTEQMFKPRNIIDS